MAEILTGDCRDVLAGMEPDSFDSCVTDPPYHLTNGATGPAGFMGQQWDGGDVAFRPETWAAVYRVLKPGAHLLAFSGTRTQHRMVCAIEDAGFEIRDQIYWHYGSGFPKSHNISAALDRMAGVEPEKVARHRTDGKKTGSGGASFNASDVSLTSGPAITYLARQWRGWGTALKPATEPICVARKPLIGTVAANVQRFGTGALNIDGCRVEMNGETVRTGQGTRDAIYGGGKGLRPAEMGTQPFTSHALGRWPANLCHDGSEEVLAGFPRAKGAVSNGSKTQEGHCGTSTFKIRAREQKPGYADDGSAARFFASFPQDERRFMYCPKATKAERGEGNTHPTVKPIALMRWLCRLITPPGGHVLDPFGGSGSTGIAADREGFRATLVEMSPEYAAMAKARLTADAPLFMGAAE